MESGAEWSLDAVQALRKMAGERMTPSEISLRLKRPVQSIRAKLNELGITPVPEI